MLADMIKKYASADTLFNEAQEMGLDPKWETPHGLFSFQHNNQPIYVFYTKLHLNSQLGSWMCQDKYLTRVVLEKHNFPVIPFCYTSEIEDVYKFLDAHRTIIQKPVLGQRSENTHLIKTKDEIITTALDEWIFERYIPGTEYRCLVLEKEVIAMQEKRLVPTLDNPWAKKSIALERPNWNKEMTEMSVAIAHRLQMGLVAVDFILDKDNKIWHLEANSMPGVHYFNNPDEGKGLNVARMILSSVIKNSTHNSHI